MKAAVRQLTNEVTKLLTDVRKLLARLGEPINVEPAVLLEAQEPEWALRLEKKVDALLGQEDEPAPVEVAKEPAKPAKEADKEPAKPAKEADKEPAKPAKEADNPDGSLLDQQPPKK